jgi:hypothetical protein
MTDPNFERSLRAAARRGQPGGVHPDASLLAAYVDRGLSDTERAELEVHVADCSECMERLALLGSVNVPDEPEVPSLEWSPRQLLSRWGWLVPVATVVVLVAVWERQPPRPASSAPASPAAPAVQKQMPPAPNEDADERNERSPRPFEEAQREAGFAKAPTHQTPEAPKAKDASARPELQAGAREGAPLRQAPPSGGAAADALALRDKKEVDALSPLKANKVAAKPAPAPAATPPATKPVQAEDAASVVAGRADEAKPGNQPQAAAVAPMRETIAQGALLKSAIEAPLVLASGPGVSIRRSGTELERSTDNGATWAVDLADAPAGLHVGSCPTTAVCWLGGSQGIVLLRQASGSWTRHVVADGHAAVTAIHASDALTATVSLSDGRSLQTSDGGVTWVGSK